MNKHFKKGHTPWNKGLVGYNTGHEVSEETKRKISMAKLGKKASEEHRKNISRTLTGRKLTEEHKRNISKNSPKFWLGKELTAIAKEKLSRVRAGRPRPLQSGKNSHFWKGGITPINEAIRRSLKYRLWRKSVFERDNYTCVLCGQIGGELNADHIKPFAYYPELRFELSNGRTLCKPCHLKTDTYSRRYMKTKILLVNSINC